MSKTTFQTHPRSLQELLTNCDNGKLQLPDFQRNWVWAEDRILSLIASISQAFPVGALMTLRSHAHAGEIFARRPIEGASRAAAQQQPDELLLDGQQRMTSLFHSCLRKEVVKTITPQKRVVERWFYIDIEKALSSGFDREEAIFTTTADKKIWRNFNRDLVLDISSTQREFEELCFPLNQVFDWDDWQEGLINFLIGREEMAKFAVFTEFKNKVLENFKSYQIPVIALDDDTPHEAVCLVFEKVNTGGKPLDAFELLTAMYAAQGHKLRDDWLGTDDDTGLHSRLKDCGKAGGQNEGVLAKVASTDFLQAIALLHTKEMRRQAYDAGRRDRELPAIRATRQSLLDLPLKAYLSYRDDVERGFYEVAKFLRELHIHRPFDLPYQTQLVPLAAIFAELGNDAEHSANREKLVRWFWCGVFGELYGSSAESRFARDIAEVPEWIRGGEEPSTVREGFFQADRLRTMRSRQSAAYKGINALLMLEGARDFRSGQKFDTTVFFGESVDIHHIFPQKWCKQQAIEAKIYDSIINKTPLTYRTNRIIGGAAPSKYLSKIEKGKSDDSGNVIEPPLPRSTLECYLDSHCIPTEPLWADNFETFMEARKDRLLELVKVATGHDVNQDGFTEGVEAEDEGEGDAAE